MLAGSQARAVCAPRAFGYSPNAGVIWQGVVNGVLLVTPNAVMFDPNVSDALVLENGAEQYSMITPMETIISAAIYHDVSPMTIQSLPQ